MKWILNPVEDESLAYEILAELNAMYKLSSTMPWLDLMLK